MANPDLRLLSLDGGGVRGLASLYMLKQAMTYVGNPKPCDYFDIICGTSTGGLIAIMLGRLRMTIDESIHAFTELMEDIFAQGRKGLPFDLKNGKVRPRYSSSTLETAFKNVIMKAGFNKDALFRWRSGYGCYTFVVALTELSTQPVAITDYEPPHEQQSTFYNGIKIWEAARATSAATSFFKPIKIEVSGMPRNFVDGGIGWNNPINTLLPQAGKLYPPPATLRSRIRVILSVGTGVIPPFAIGATVPQVVRTLVEIATETEHTASDFHHNNRDLVDRGAYYRFNPPYLNEIALDQAEKKPLIAERCELYGSQPHVLADMERWAIAAGEDFTLTRQCVVEPVLFDVLYQNDSIYKKEGPEPWQRLTLRAYWKYAELYEACRRADGRVNYEVFIRLFRNEARPDSIFSKVMPLWLQFTGSTQTQPRSLSKTKTMALLYMLHMGLTWPTDETRLGRARQERLINFDKWIGCACNEERDRAWSFVNEIGMHNGVESQSCEMLRLSQRQERTSSIVKKWSRMREDWYHTRDA